MIKMVEKFDFKKMKWQLEAYRCLLFKNTSFRFFQRSGAKICVKHQMSFWGVLEPHPKNPSKVPFVLPSYLPEKKGLRFDIIFLNNTEVCAF